MSPDVQDVTANDDRFAADLRGFGPIGIGAMLIILLTGNMFVGPVIVPIGAMLALVWVRLSRTRWSDVGYARPANWITVIAAGIALGVTLKFVMKALVMPLLGAPPVNPATRFLTGNPETLSVAIWAMFVAGFAEETVFRGYLFERLGRLLGRGVAATVFIVVLTSAWFGFGHYSLQGIPGVQQGTIMGLLYGTIYAMTRRIWLLICAHTAFDLAALAMIYWNLEAEVARFIFK
jgi:hypothetical protein